MAEKRILVGQVGAAHGIQGEVRVKSFTEPMEAMADYGPLASEDGTRVLTVQRLRPNDTVLVVKFHEVPDRNAAEALNGTRLFVDREALPPPEDDETFYHSDLIGLRAEGEDGQVLGTVLAVPNFGAGDLLEVQPAEGSTVYVPFTKACVPLVDVAGGRVVVVPPEGLFGGSAEEAPPPSPGRRRPAPERGGDAS
jgi:16S rRNA processing protein RimM